MDGCHFFLVGSAWLLGFRYFMESSRWFLMPLGGLWMVAVVSWWALDGSLYFLVGFGWFTGKKIAQQINDKHFSVTPQGC